MASNRLTELSELERTKYALQRKLDLAYVGARYDAACRDIDACLAAHGTLEKNPVLLSYDANATYGAMHIPSVQILESLATKYGYVEVRYVLPYDGSDQITLRFYRNIEAELARTKAEIAAMQATLAALQPEGTSDPTV
jgi:hypothetical protein